MFIDALTKVCAKQAFTAAAVSEKSIDLGDVTPKRTIGTGEEVGFAGFVDVAADCTSVKTEVIQATDEALTTAIVVLAERTHLAADLPAGKAIFMPLPVSEPTAGSTRFIGVRVTPSGGNATVTMTWALMPRSMFAVKAKAYAAGSSIS